MCSSVRFAESYTNEMKSCSEKLDTLIKVVAKITAGEKPNNEEVPMLLRRCQQAIEEFQDLKLVAGVQFGIPSKGRRLIE